jgi:integrase
MAIITPAGRFRGDEVRDGERKYLEPMEVRALFQALSPEPFWTGYFRLQYYFGCRVSEPAIILKEDVELEKKRILIRRLKQVSRREDGGFQVRDYDLPDKLIALLRPVQKMVPDANPWFFGSAVRRKHAGKARMCQIRRLDDGWSSVSSASAELHFKAAASEAGIPANLAHTHVLRHTRATLMIAGGARLEDVQFLLGHTKLVTTQMYVGWAQAMRKRMEGTAEMALGDLD